MVAIVPKLKEAVQASLPVIIGSFASGHSGNHDWIAIMIASLTGLFAIGTYWTTRFSIEPDHVVHTSGWIFRKDRRIPLKQIQNVNIRQNVLERIFRVATIDVETAMGRGRDLKLSVLGLAEAERFREELLGAAHLSETSRNVDTSPVVRLNSHDLLLGAVTENHLPQMIIGMVTVIGPALSGITTYASKLSQSAGMLAFGVASIALPVGSWLWGAASYYLKYGGFEVHRTHLIFRISYGLLNKVQLAVRPSRIEILRITATLPQRWMQRASLHLGTASSFGDAGVLAPVALFVDTHRAMAGASEVFPSLVIPTLQWRNFHPIFYISPLIRSFVSMIFVILFAYGMSTIMSGIGLASVIGVSVFIAFMILVRVATLLLSIPENGYALTDQMLVVRSGYYHQTISSMPIERMENLAVTQPLWWSNRGAASLTVQAMKHRIHVSAIPVEAIEELRAIWRERIEWRENRGMYRNLAVEASAEPEDILALEDPITT